MNIFRNVFRAVFSPLGIINKNTVECKLQASVLMVLTAAFTGSVLAPLLYYLSYKSKLEISMSISGMLIMLLVSILSWTAECLLFRLLSILFRKQVSFEEIASTWGFSYAANFLCIVAYSFLQVKFDLIIGSGIAGFLVNTFFIMLLIWKAIYFFMEMKFVIETTGFELLVFTIAAGIVFALLMAAGSMVGIQVPML